VIRGSDLLALLAERHKSDVFVPECKNGPTQIKTARQLRLDAWAMPRSWVPLRFFGYEIKVSRSDFLKDDKIPAYLPLCTDLYVACQRNLIQPEELPAEIGLLWASDNASRFFTKRKAVHRNISPPIELFAYILMCRTKIKCELGPIDRMEHYKRMLQERKDLGRSICKAMNREISDRVKGAELRADEAEAKALQLQNVERAFKELGFDPSSVGGYYNIRSRLRSALSLKIPETIALAHKAIDQIKETRESATEACDETEAG